jgi:hypothetical protein
MVAPVQKKDRACLAQAQQTASAFCHFRAINHDFQPSTAASMQHPNAKSRHKNAQKQYPSNCAQNIQFHPPSLRANGSGERPPDDRLREAIQEPQGKSWIASQGLLAMTTEHIAAFSRHDVPEVWKNFRPRQEKSP